MANVSQDTQRCVGAVRWLLYFIHLLPTYQTISSASLSHVGKWKVASGHRYNQPRYVLFFASETRTQRKSGLSSNVDFLSISSNISPKATARARRKENKREIDASCSRSRLLDDGHHRAFWTRHHLCPAGGRNKDKKLVEYIKSSHYKQLAPILN